MSELSDHDQAILTAREWLAKEPYFLDTETTSLGAGADHRGAGDPAGCGSHRDNRHVAEE